MIVAANGYVMLAAFRVAWHACAAQVFDCVARDHVLCLFVNRYLDHEDGWRKYYEFTPLPFPSVDNTRFQFILGGEGKGCSLVLLRPVSCVNCRLKLHFSAVAAAIWTEKVNQNNFDCRVWPRGAAVAEKLWSSHQVCCCLMCESTMVGVVAMYATMPYCVQSQTSSSFYPRMWHHSHRLNTMGISSYITPAVSSIPHVVKQSKNVTSSLAAFAAGFSSEVLPSSAISAAAVLLDSAQCFQIDQRSHPFVAPRYAVGYVFTR